jgi:anti-anti-sigma regulatory factor
MSHSDAIAGTFKVSADGDANQLTICYTGSISASIAAACLEAVRFALPQLGREFKLLVDLTRLQSMDPSCVPVIGAIMDLCNAHGVSLVVRIIPDPTHDIGLQIMSLFHYRGDVQVFTCSNAVEASRMLA